MMNRGGLNQILKTDNDLILKVIIQSKKRIARKLKTSGIINAHESFKEGYKLSLKKGKYLLFEHIDENPLFINNFGMASKLTRYIYSDRFFPLKYFQQQPAGMGQTSHIGYYGAQVLMSPENKLPLLGNVKEKDYQGISLLENNMYKAPVFFHRAPKTDFLCVIH